MQMDTERVDQIIASHGGEASALIQVLLDIQAENHWLPMDALERVSGKLGVSLARIRHIASFYTAFSLVPKGRHEVHVCVGTACHVRGASRVLNVLEDATGIHPGETDLALKFSLETVNCLGCCSLGPVVQVDGKIHGNMSTGGAEDVLKKYT